jgi:hypothetical protein
MLDYDKIEAHCIEHLEVDYMPLHDIVREFSGYDKSPSETDFISAMKFLDYLTTKHRLRYLEGPTMVESHVPANKMIDWLKKKWNLNKYDEINYKIWLDKE